MAIAGVLHQVDWKRLNEGIGKSAAATHAYFKTAIRPKLKPAFEKYFLIPFYRAGTKLFARIIWRPHVTGFEKLPKKGPALIVSNHVSYIDGFLIYAMSRRPIRFVIDYDIYMLPGVHHFMRLARAIPILPTRESVSQALAEVSDALRAGELVGVFPEGTLTRSGSLGRFRPGVEWMLKRDEVPVYPMAINGLWGSVFSRKYIKSRFPWWPRHWGAKISITCGDPIPPEQANINRLQREVMRLKYAAPFEQHQS
jgi:1-acyl-sn-glycerol-3-phosphate acyltransferase